MPPSKKTHRISRICFDSQPRRFHFTICHLIGWVNWISTGRKICKFWGRQTRMTGIRAGGSSRRSRSLTRLRRDCRCSLPISPAAPPLVLARLSRPPKPPATQAKKALFICSLQHVSYAVRRKRHVPAPCPCHMSPSV